MSPGTHCAAPGAALRAHGVPLASRGRFWYTEPFIWFKEA